MMDPPRTIVKKISTTNFNTPHLNSASSFGASSPRPGSRTTDRVRPMSPAVSRPQFTVKRPPLVSNRVLDGNKRAPSPFDHRPFTAGSADFRSHSSLSNRSALPSPAISRAAENTIVSVRIRPAQSESFHRPWAYDEIDHTISSGPGVPGPPLQFSFDHVFAEATSNATIYDSSVKRLVAGVVEGFHGTVFAYGMTGTGKTYSMQGVPDSPGIIPQAVSDIFRLIAQDPANRYSLRASYLEIYNERLRDLLNESAGEAEEIKIREDPKRGIHAYPLVEKPILSVEKFLDIMAQGDALRHSAATDFNAHSSRSHAVVQIIVESTPIAMDVRLAHIGGTARISTLNLIDLAGSEKAASDADRRKEGSYINKSLLTLGTVIARLTSESSASLNHVPFRDSKLTRLLQHALSGLSLVSILATINSDSKSIMETTNTLKFASRAKFIQGKVRKAELFGGDVGLLVESLRAEISLLRIQLADSQALVAKLQDATPRGFRTLSDGTNIDSNTSLSDIHEDKLVFREQDGKTDDHISEACTVPMQFQQPTLRIGPVKGHPSVIDITSVSPPVSSPAPSNFSHPSSRTQHGALGVDLSTPTRSATKAQEETKDKLNSLADKELASSVLTKSQKSREEARTLQIQIAQLKKREDKKMTFGGRLTFLNKSTSSLSDGKENSDITNTKPSLRLQHTLVSPTLRAPREGFI